MRTKTMISPCKYLQLSLLFSAPLWSLATVAAQTPAASETEMAEQRQEALEFSIPEAEQISSDSYDLLVFAGKNIIPGGEGTPATDEKLSPQEDLRRQRAFIEKNARSLAMMNEALKTPIIAPAERDSQYFSAFENGEELRKLALLAAQRNRVYAADQEWDTAISGALDILQMGAAISRDAGPSSLISGKVIQGSGQRDLWNWLEHSDVKTAQKVAQRLEEVGKNAPSAVAIVREEKWRELSTLQGIVTSPEWEKFRQGKHAAFKQMLADSIENPVDVERLRQFAPVEILRHYAATMDAVAAQAALPFTRENVFIAPAGDPFSDSWSSLYTRSGKAKELKFGRLIAWRFGWIKPQLENRFLMTAFALHAFRKENGKYPEKLDELQSKYLREVPIDPFGQNAPLIYRRDGEKYLLYSVGADGIDNGGVPIKPKLSAAVSSVSALAADGDILPGQPF